ncbi:MAG: hypothetical protein ACRCUY_08660 [Thermoguttaceae bacterium]
MCVFSINTGISERLAQQPPTYADGSPKKPANLRWRLAKRNADGSPKVKREFCSAKNLKQ